METRKFLSAVALGLAGSAPFAVATASNYFVVTPAVGRVEAAVDQDPIQVELLQGVVPAATAWAPYNYDVWQNLRITGDPDFNPAEVVFYSPNVLPPGLTLTPDGKLAGVATEVGDVPIEVIAQYRDEQGSQTYMLRINLSTVVVTLTDSKLDRARIGETFSHSFRDALTISRDDTPENERPPVTWEAQDLPAGMYIDTDGVLSGSPTAKTNAAGQNIRVTARYKGRQSARNYVLTVGGQPLKVSKVATGASHSCAITLQNALLCWGNNNFGQLGTGTADASSIDPKPVVGMQSGVSHVVVTDSTTCAIQNGAAKCWGQNAYAVLGQPAAQLPRSNSPVQIPGLTSGVTDFALGDRSACAIQSGSAKCWGENRAAQLGNGTRTNSATPVQVDGLASGVTSIDVGARHACAVQSGEVKCWGSNGYGQLGLAPNFNAELVRPGLIVGLPAGITQVTVGSEFSCAVVSATPWCWGNNLNQQLGVPAGRDGFSYVPAQVPGVSGVSSMLSYKDSSCALVSGSAVCWGDNNGGKMGLGFSVSTVAPSALQTASITGMDIGTRHGCVVVDQEAKCFGEGSAGELGAGVPFSNFNTIQRQEFAGPSVEE